MSVELCEVMADKVFDQIQIDRDGAKISNMTLLSPMSRNGRTYSEQSIRDAMQLYEGARYYVDHPTESETKDRQGVRSVRDLAGKISNIRAEGEYPDIKVRGDVQLLKGTPMTESILSIAEQMPDMAGNSHRVMASVKRNTDGSETVDRIDRVMGMELVTDPATTSGLFESMSSTKTTGDEPLEDDTVKNLAELKEKHPDIYQAAIDEHVANNDQAEKIKQQDDKIVALESKVKAFEDQEKGAELKKKIDTKLEAAKLPAHAITATFRETLESCETDEQMDKQIEDRKAIAGNAKPVPVPERDPETYLNEDFKPVDSDVVATASQRLFA